MYANGLMTFAGVLGALRTLNLAVLADAFPAIAVKRSTTIESKTQAVPISASDIHEVQHDRHRPGRFGPGAQHDGWSPWAWGQGSHSRPSSGCSQACTISSVTTHTIKATMSPISTTLSSSTTSSTSTISSPLVSTSSSTASSKDTTSAPFSSISKFTPTSTITFGTTSLPITLPYVSPTRNESVAGPPGTVPFYDCLNETSNRVMTDQKWIDTAIVHHNLIRANHSAPPLEWSHSLACFAKELGDACVFHHNTPDSSHAIGQNIGVGYTYDRIGDLITNDWYGSEWPSYHAWGHEPNKDPSAGPVDLGGHLTQIVWKGSTSFGCYWSYCDGYQLTFCNYAPPGNVGGAYADNVLPGRGDRTLTGNYDCDTLYCPYPQLDSKNQTNQPLTCDNGECSKLEAD